MKLIIILPFLKRFSKRNILTEAEVGGADVGARTEVLKDGFDIGFGEAGEGGEVGGKFFARAREGAVNEIEGFRSGFWGFARGEEENL